MRFLCWCKGFQGEVLWIAYLWATKVEFYKGCWAWEDRWITFGFQVAIYSSNDVVSHCYQDNGSTDVNPTSHSRHRKGSFSFCVLRLEGGCNYDYILVYDGPEYNSSLIARVCDGSNGSFTSTGNFMSVVFITDGSVTRRGFQAHYYSTVSTSKFPCENECPCGIRDVTRDYLSLRFLSLWQG